MVRDGESGATGSTINRVAARYQHGSRILALKMRGRKTLHHFFEHLSIDLESIALDVRREESMPVREFRDSSGREWRTWEVAPDDLNARTKDEDFLASLYYTGWLVFETKAGTDKRRLHPIPRGWSQLPEADLLVLLNKAEVVPPRKLRAERLTGEAAAREVQRAHDFVEQTIDSPEEARQVAGQETPDVTDLSVVRSFRYPGGRLWSACVVRDSEDNNTPVLRFSAGTRHIDLRDWPKDWPDYEDEELVNLLRRALPRDTTTQLDSDAAQRRWDDSSPT